MALTIDRWLAHQNGALGNLKDADEQIDQAIQSRDAGALKNALSAYSAALSRADSHSGHLRPLEREIWKSIRAFFDIVGNAYADKLIPTLLFNASKSEVDFEQCARVKARFVERYGDPVGQLSKALEEMAGRKFLEHESSFGRFKILDRAGLPLQAGELEFSAKLLFQALRLIETLFKRRKLSHLLGGILYLEHWPHGRHGAAYMRRNDRIEVNTAATAAPARLARNLIHELGHRIWFRFMDSGQRDAFSAQWIEKGEDPEEPATRLPSVTPYGTKNRHDDFAETFTEVVMGRQKDRQLAERLQAVLPKGRVLSSVTADVAAMNEFVRSVEALVPPIAAARQKAQSLLDAWDRTGEVNTRQLKLALTAYNKQVAKLGDLKLPSNLRPGEREILQDKLNAMGLFYVENVGKQTEKLKKQLTKLGSAKAKSFFEYRIGDVDKMLREMSLPGLLENAAALVEPELKFGNFTILDNHGIKEVRARYWFEVITRASKILKSKGLDYLLYGKLVLEPVEKGFNGLYHTRGDYLSLQTGKHGRPNERMIYTFVHELGHRLWFKFLDAGARDKFAGEWVDQAADTDRLYRKMAPMMEVSKQEAEEGWRVLSDGWDMRAFRKWAKADDARKLRWFLALKRVYALSVSETERFVTDDGVTNKRAFDLTREHFERLKARMVSRDASISGQGGLEEGIRRAQKRAEERYEKDMQMLRDDVVKATQDIPFNKHVLHDLLEPDRFDVKLPLPRNMYRKAFDFLPSVRPSVTEYGQTNRMEDFAEVFAQTVLGMNKDRAVMQRLQAVLPKGRVLSSYAGTVRLTAEQLTRALWNKGVDAINRGVYEGTDIPWRKVPKDAVVTVEIRQGGAVVRDEDGGWIADRFGPSLGHRDGQRVAKYMGVTAWSELRRSDTHHYPGKPFDPAAVAGPIVTAAVGQDWFGPNGQRYRIVEDTGDGWRVEIQHRSSDLPAEESWTFTKQQFERLKESLPLSQRADARVIPVPKHEIRKIRDELMAQLRAELKRRKPDATLKGWYTKTVPLTVETVRGQVRTYQVGMKAQPMGGPRPLRGGGAGGGIGRSVKTGQRVIVVFINDKTPVKSLESLSDVIASDLYQVLLHEVTHAVDVEGKEQQKPEYSADYVNDPREVRAFMQEIVQEVVTFLERHGKLLAGKFGASWALNSALKMSETWQSISPELNEQNRKRIRKAAFQAAWPLLQEAAAAAPVEADAPTMPFKVGDVVLFGKYKNKRGRIVKFGRNPKGQVTVQIDPIPKGRKKTKEMGLFKIWTTPDAIEAVAQVTAAADELYHTTSLHGLAKILQSRTFRSGPHGGFISFSERPYFGDISANDAVLVLDKSTLRNRVMPVEYTERWYDRYPEHAGYIAGEGWREQYFEPDDCYDEEGWADDECLERAYRDAELESFLWKRDEREWISRSSGDLRLPAEAFKRIVVPRPKFAAVETVTKKLGLKIPVKVLKTKSRG